MSHIMALRKGVPMTEEVKLMISHKGRDRLRTLWMVKGYKITLVKAADQGGRSIP